MRSNSEFSELAGDYTASHGGRLVELACLSALTKAIFDKFATLKGERPAKLEKLQRDCLDLMAAEYGYGPNELTAAIDGLDRAAQTSMILRACDAPADTASGVSAAQTSDLLARAASR